MRNNCNGHWRALFHCKSTPRARQEIEIAVGITTDDSKKVFTLNKLLTVCAKEDTTRSSEKRQIDSPAWILIHSCVRPTFGPVEIVIAVHWKWKLSWSGWGEGDCALALYAERICWRHRCRLLVNSTQYRLQCNIRFPVVLNLWSTTQSLPLIFGFKFFRFIVNPKHVHEALPWAWIVVQAQKRNQTIRIYFSTFSSNPDVRN